LEHELRQDNDEPIVSDELMASLRLIVMSNDELEQYTITTIDQLLSSMVNIDNERRALNKLLSLLNDLKEKFYTTTLNDNLDRLRSNDVNDNQRYSLIYLIGQKQIVEDACRWLADRRSQLE
jgi:hypothetical protein